MIFFTLVIAKWMEKYLDITKPRYSEHFLPVPWFCYLRLYFGVDIVSRRLFQWTARIENGLKLRPTTKRCKQHYKYVFFVYCSLLGVFCTGNIIRKKKGQVLNKLQTRLLLENPGGSESRQISISIFNNYRNQSHLVVHTSPAYFSLYRRSWR